jgi:hypothetical protein
MPYNFVHLNSCSFSITTTRPAILSNAAFLLSNAAFSYRWLNKARLPSAPPKFKELAAAVEAAQVARHSAVCLILFTTSSYLQPPPLYNLLLLTTSSSSQPLLVCSRVTFSQINVTPSWSYSQASFHSSMSSASASASSSASATSPLCELHAVSDAHTERLVKRSSASASATAAALLSTPSILSDESISSSHSSHRDGSTIHEHIAIMAEEVCSLTFFCDFSD